MYEVRPSTTPLSWTLVSTLRADLIHPHTLWPRSLPTTSVSSVYKMDGPSSESPASASSWEGGWDWGAPWSTPSTIPQCFQLKSTAPHLHCKQYWQSIKVDEERHLPILAGDRSTVSGITWCILQQDTWVRVFRAVRCKTAYVEELVLFKHSSC